jgi:hypothetical protein
LAIGYRGMRHKVVPPGGERKALDVCCQVHAHNSLMRP